MAPRTSWKGFIKLSLVSVPVKAFTAHDTGEQVRLNQLHAECNGRVKYQKICPEHGELGSKDIVSGYEYAKGQYVVIDPDEVKSLRTASDRSVAIEGFIKPDEIPPRQHAGKSYYLLPDGVAGVKPYALLHKGMVDGGVQALAQIVLSGREQIVLLRPVENLIEMSVLHYAKRVKSIHEFTAEMPQAELSDSEVTLANTLIAASRIEEFEFSEYKDRYVENMTRLIEMKIEGEEVVQAPDPEEPKIINLMDALKKSVAEAQAAAATASGGDAPEDAADAADAADPGGAQANTPKSAAKKAPAKKKATKKKAAAKKKMAPSASRKKVARQKSG